MQKNFKRLRVQNLKWLQTCIEARDSGPQIRAKSVRALSMFIQADARLLASKEVAACFETALKVSSILPLEQDNIGVFLLFVVCSLPFESAKLCRSLVGACDPAIWLPCRMIRLQSVLSRSICLELTSQTPGT